MANAFPIPPTYAPIIERDQSSGKESFSSLWLQWFLDVARYFQALTGTTHNALNGLQGGTPGEYYHFTSAAYAALSGTRTLKGVQATDDLIVDNNAKGLVLKDAQATPHYWRVTISNVGALIITDLGTTIP